MLLKNLCYLLLIFQAPEEIPKDSDNDPVDFTAFENILIYIIIPILIFVLYFVWRQMKQRERKKRR
ncbi:adenylosuccinate synthetase [Zhouia spongiae]|uniref:Adenylosuccinate synthetase n=1 Tax=Zhouia spongiae TaxID=2202721 RepID=A0ABY3YKJ7_9FLAO|nr:adenylosuccinate synthetase [Zhouia spongiae]UNY98213.1 adenylosuccinate synthetase [Zhouia spongiae]